MNEHVNNRSSEKTIGLLVLLLFVSFYTVSSLAQDSSARKPANEFWARVGAGVAGTSGYFGFGGTVGIQYSSPIGLFGVRYIGSDKTTVDPATLGETRLTEISEIAVTWGTSTKISFLHFSASTGLGVVWGRQKNTSGDEHFTTVGLPLEGEVTLRPLPVFGIGALLSSTINPKKTIINPMIVLHIGKLR